MKKIINGRRYDTATAEKICDASNGLSRSDFRFVEESLYRTKNGNWFVAGIGGAMSKYARRVGDMDTDGENLFPLDPGEAREMLEEENEQEALETYFADSIRDA